jgi:monovalent cation:H+ antiporter, CPA1 family
MFDNCVSGPPQHWSPTLIHGDAITVPVSSGITVEGLIGLLLIAALVAVAVRFVRIPYTVALVLTGLALALLPDTPHYQLTPGIILTIFLPVLLFYGAYNLNPSELRATILPVTLLAIPGVVITAGLVGLALHLTTQLSWEEALLFGTIVSATDPVAVLAIFGDLSAPRRLSTLVTSESLFNDGTALVFFATMLTIVTSHSVDPGRTIEHFLLDIMGSLTLGAAIGLVGSAVIRHVDEALLETTFTLIIAYGGYLAANRLGISGPLETVAAGLVLGARGLDVMSPTTRLQAGATWEFLDFLANSLLFLLMGLALRPVSQITASRLGIDLWWPMIVAIIAVTLSRIVVVGAVHGVLARSRLRLPRGWPTVITWSGLRGAVSFAAALSLPASVPQRDLLLTLTFGIVLFTLLAQGMTIRPLLARLGIGAEDLSRHDAELIIGRLRMLDAGSREVDGLVQAEVIDSHLADPLLAQYAEQKRELRAQLDATYHGSDGLESEGEYEVRRRLLRVQRDAARAALVHGQISQSVFRELVAEVDRELARLEAYSHHA